MTSLKLAFRTLFKTPFVTAIAVISLALGIGANAATFSMFDQMLLQALPVQEPGELVNLGSPGPKPGSQSCGQAGDCEWVFSYPMYRDIERTQTALEGVAAHVLFGANIAYERQTINGSGLLVSGSYFPLLGVRPVIGRLFTPEDDRNIGGHFVAVLSYEYWNGRLGADPAVLNEQITVNGQSLTVVGVAARDFSGTTLGARPDIFVPLTMRGLMNPGFNGFENRRSYWAYLFGRLKPGMTIEQAKVGLNATYKPIINDVEAPLQEGMSEQTLARFRAKEITVEAGQRGQSSVHGEARVPLIFLFSITGVVLLIACANIANLLLARGANRATEMAVRLSLGASRWQIVRQLLIESVILALMGGIASLLVAQWTLSGIGSMMPADASSTLKLELQPSVMLFAGGMAIATGLLFGIFPALHSTRPDLITTLRATAGQPSGARAAARFRTSLVTTQIALSMALLVSAGLFIKSLMNVSRVDLGVEIDNVVTFGLSPELNAYERGRMANLFSQVEQELAALPGVTAVAASRVPLIAGSNWGNSVQVEGFESGPDVDNGSRFNQISVGYFSTLGVPLLAGREFEVADGRGAPEVAIVNEAFTKKFGLGREAVGKRMNNGGPEDPLDIQIVGVVQDAKYSDVKQEIPPVFFLPYRQDSTVGSMNFYARTAQQPEALLRVIPAMIAKIDPNLPVEELKTMPMQIRETIFLDRMISVLSAAFAGIATLLAAVGLYGVLAYTVAQRTREIGVRMALGADSSRVQGMVLRQVGWMTLIGGVIGIAAALALGRWAQSLLFELKGHDPFVVGASAALLAVVAFGAGYIPARRASQVQPMQALRYE